jgi:hypothetical protein
VEQSTKVVLLAERCGRWNESDRINPSRGIATDLPIEIYDTLQIAWETKWAEDEKWESDRPTNPTAKARFQK